MGRDSEYTYLNESAFNEEVLKHHKPVIVEFGADWCGSCQLMKPIISNITAAYREQVKIVKLDVDRNKHLVEKYGIREKPTFLLLKNGEIVDHIVRSVSRKDFEAKLIRLLSSE